MKAVAIERAHGRRSQPQIVIDLRQIGSVVGRLGSARFDVQRVPLAGGHRTVRVLPDRRARFEAQAASHIHLADAALLDEFDGFAHDRPAAVHRADLDDLVVASRGLDHPAPLGDRVRGRLLDVHVLARLERPDGGERVPVIRRGDDDAVDVLVIEHAAEILLESRTEGRDICERLVVDPLGREVGVDVAEGLDLDVLQLCEPALQRVALSSDPDAGQHHAIVGAAHAGAGQRCGL